MKFSVLPGLGLGGDDYVTKPFSVEELVARVQAVMRRSAGSGPSDHRLTFADLTLDEDTREVWRAGGLVELTATEFKLLALLIDRRGRTQSRETLLYDVWGYQNTIDTRTVDTHMRRLREKLGGHANRLETVRGEGYRFNPVAAV